MIYNNLLIFLTAIFLFSINGGSETPTSSLPQTLLILFVILGGYAYLAFRMFRNPSARNSEGYFSIEKRLSILALFFFAFLLFGSDIKYFLNLLLFGDTLPLVTNIAGLSLFLSFLSLMWLAARKRYILIFGRSYSRVAFLGMNIRSNLPIVLPWMALSLVYDLLVLLPYPGLQEFVFSKWGDLVFFGFFLVFVMLFFPPLVRRLWGCKKIRDGALKDHLVAFCRKQNFNAEIYVWPLFEGRVLTAGVMGLVPGLRYILLTPAIIETLTISELEAVVAHELGHVKKKHLLLYVLLIGGFSALAGFLAEPLLYFSFSFDWVFDLMTGERIDPETVIGLISGVPMLFFLLLYFRFVFGYFIRNFERQADLYVFKVIGSSHSLVSAFDKIADTSGSSKDKPSWHHFGIGERIAYLERCEKDPSWIKKQDRKVHRSLAVYILLLVSAVFLALQVPTETMVKEYEEKYIELVLMGQVKNVEDKVLWYRAIGDLMVNRKMEQRALVAYNKALEAEPENAEPELLNNMAWLLLTSDDPLLRDPERALVLAKAAAKKDPKAHVLDTLATAYWANGYRESAIATENAALKRATSQAEFYRSQLEKFKTETYGENTRFLKQ